MTIARSTRPFFVALRAYRRYEREQGLLFRPDHALRWGLRCRKYPRIARQHLQREAVDQHAGSLTGAFEPGYLKKLRDAWVRPGILPEEVERIASDPEDAAERLRVREDLAAAAFSEEPPWDPEVLRELDPPPAPGTPERADWFADRLRATAETMPEPERTQFLERAEDLRRRLRKALARPDDDRSGR